MKTGTACRKRRKITIIVTNHNGEKNNGYGTTKDRSAEKQMVSIVISSFILHNILIDLVDDTEIGLSQPENINDPSSVKITRDSMIGQFAKRRRDLFKMCFGNLINLMFIGRHRTTNKLQQIILHFSNTLKLSTDLF